ncbi:MAG TPA: metallophosphoesterase [Pseudolysinimonas sp.]|nr:metallophosphoesterase [Pseudolysinimonas sp.]
MTTQFGQYAPPTHVVAHLSDTHLLGGARPLYGTVDTDAPLAAALARLESGGIRVDALVITGDLTELGEPEAYRRLRELVEPVAKRLGAELVWVMGNHDVRAAYAAELRGEATADAGPQDVGPQDVGPQDAVHEVAGLRIISLDTTVPGYHHGDIRESQLEWLAEQLAEPAPHGTVLALHHPPIPSSVEVMALLELRNQAALAKVIRGRDVRAILGGHLHYATAGQFAGIPVFVAAGSCYVIDAGADPASLIGHAAGQTLSLVHMRPGAVTTSAIPLDEGTKVVDFPPVIVQAFAAMTPEARLEAFSSKTSTFTREEAHRIVAGETGAPQ